MTLLFCATDAGGARNLAPVARLARDRGRAVQVIASGITADLFAEAGVTADCAAPVDDAAALALLAELRPAGIFCGTARHPIQEARLIAAGGRFGCRSIVVLDEWYGYRSRFAAGLPDLICCPDSQACDEAAAEGLPIERLRVTGSPALAGLADRVEAFAEAPPPVPAEWGDAACRVLFLSETHAEDYGSTSAGGPCGPYLGYTEDIVRADLAQALAALGRPFAVVEKMHPASLTLPSAPLGVPWRSVARVPLWPLLWHADLVVSMRSMALLEAALMGQRPLSYQPGLIGPDQCTAARLDLADSGRSVADLTDWLATDEGRRRGSPNRPSFAHRAAAAAVLDLASSSRHQ